MFSTTTTSASISMPIAIASPPRLIKLADMPTARMAISAMTMAERQAERDHQRSPPVAEEQQQQDDDETVASPSARTTVPTARPTSRLRS